MGISLEYFLLSCNTYPNILDFLNPFAVDDYFLDWGECKFSSATAPADVDHLNNKDGISLYKTLGQVNPREI